MFYRDKNWLTMQYWGFNLTLNEMGNLVNVSRCTIRNWMKHFGIPIRYRFHHLKYLNQNKEHQSKAGKGRAKWTNSHYSHLASKRMKENNISYLSHVKWKERDPEGYRQHQINAGIKGGAVIREKMIDWDFYNEHGYLKSHAGKHPYPIEFNKKLKNQIFQRDGGICQICHKLVCNGHAIHHIDYDKNNNDFSNLVLLCESCHNKTNVFNRDYWMDFFKNV